MWSAGYWSVFLVSILLGMAKCPPQDKHYPRSLRQRHMKMKLSRSTGNSFPLHNHVFLVEEFSRLWATVAAEFWVPFRESLETLLARLAHKEKGTSTFSKHRLPGDDHLELVDRKRSVFKNILSVDSSELLTLKNKYMQVERRELSVSQGNKVEVS